MQNELRAVPVIGEPGRVADVHHERCTPDNLGNPKGARTWNYLFPTDLKAGDGRRMLAWRVRGEEVGNHFHPRTASKDPEVFMFLYGIVQAFFEDAYGDTRIIEIAVHPVGPPVHLLIPPYVLHRFAIRSRHAAFEEFQQGPYDPDETYSLEEFRLLQARYR